MKKNELSNDLRKTNYIKAMKWFDQGSPKASCFPRVVPTTILSVVKTSSALPPQTNLVTQFLWLAIGYSYQNQTLKQFRVKQKRVKKFFVVSISFTFVSSSAGFINLLFIVGDACETLSFLATHLWELKWLEQCERGRIKKELFKWNLSVAIF